MTLVLRLPQNMAIQKDEGCLASQGLCNLRVCIFFGTHVCPFVFPRIVSFWWANREGGTQSSPPGSAPAESESALVP